jgi:hypothetical protein
VARKFNAQMALCKSQNFIELGGKTFATSGIN